MYENNLPQIDHVFPQSLLKSVREPQVGTGRMAMRYSDVTRNQLANCMLLTRSENGGGGKSDTPPAVWFADKEESYLDLHLIPKDRDLWSLDRYEDFIEERTKLIADKFSWLLIP